MLKGRKIQRKLRAGALYYVIFLLFLLTVLLTNYILFVHYKNILFVRQVGISQLDSNIESAIELYQVNPEMVSDGSTASIDIFKDNPSNVKVSSEFWGVYRLIRFETKYKELSKTKIALFGNAYGSEKPFALYMTDKNRYLSVCGNSVVSGRCYLPKLGFRTSRIEGILFSGTIEKRDDYIFESSAQIPSPPDFMINNSKKIIEAEYVGINKQGDYLIGKKELYNSFYDSLLVINAIDSIWKISNVSVSGKVVLHSYSIIELESSLELQNVIVAARKIIVKKGFVGHAQLFASDTIIVEEDVKLDYPTNLCVVSMNPATISIMLRANSQVTGVVWIWNELSNATYPPDLTIEHGATIRGQVYCPGKVLHKGVVIGSMIVDLFTLKTNYAYYENYLFNATINSEELPLNFACMPFILKYPEMRFIDWVY